MNGRRIVAVVVLAVVVLAVALAVIGPGDFFLPEQSTEVDETPILDEGTPVPEADGSMAGDGTTSDGSTAGDTTRPDGVLKRGTFVGAAGHDVAGEVSLVRKDGELYLQFTNYDQQQGPDVFVYVTPSGTPDTRSEVGAGTKVLVDGGADGGESTKEGTFSQRLPRGVVAEDVGGVAIWCDRFSTPFGYATLNASG